MDLNNLTAIGRSWVGNVCQKVEGVFQEMDAIVKQNKVNHDVEQGQVTSKMVKSPGAEVTDEVSFHRGFKRTEDQLLGRDDSAGTSSVPIMLANVEEKPIQVGNPSVNIKDNSTYIACSLATYEDRRALVNMSLLNFVDTSVGNSSEQLEAELSVHGKNRPKPKSSGPDAENQSDDLAFTCRPEGQLETICEFNTMDSENIQDGDVACESHLVTPIPEEPLEGAESRKCQEFNSIMAGHVGIIVGENAINEESGASDLKSIPSNEGGLLDPRECIQLMDDDCEKAFGPEAKLSVSSSIHGNEALILLSHDTDHATVSEKSSVCPEEKSQKTELERSSSPPVLQAVDNSGTLLESFSGKNGSADALFSVKQRDHGSSSLLPPSILSVTDDLGYDLLSLDMETVDLTDKVEEPGGNVDIINNNELHALCLRVQNLRSFKKKLRDAFAPKKRLAKDYEHLGIWYGDVDIRLTEETRPTVSTPVSSLVLDSKNLQKHELTDSEWVLL